MMLLKGYPAIKDQRKLAKSVSVGNKNTEATSQGYLRQIN